MSYLLIKRWTNNSAEHCAHCSHTATRASCLFYSIGERIRTAFGNVSVVPAIWASQLLHALIVSE